MTVTAVGCIEHVTQVSAYIGCGDPAAIALIQHETLRAAQSRVAFWANVLLGLSVLAGVVGVGVAIWEAQRRVERWQAVASVALLCVGAACFLATRSIAADAQRDMPHVPQEYRSPFGDIELLPETSDCEPMPLAITVEFDQDAIRIDGLPLASPSELLFVLEPKLALTAKLNPGRELPRLLSVAATPATRVEDMALPEIWRAGFDRLFIATGAPRAAIDTATLGRVLLPARACGFELRLAQNGQPKSRFATVADLVHAARNEKKQGRTLLLAP